MKLSTNRVATALLLLPALLALSGCCEEIDKTIQVAQGGVEFYNAATTAPGMAELKKGGCTQALVITPQMIQKFAKALDETRQNQSLQGLDHHVVICHAKTQKGAPKCDDLAKTYSTKGKNLTKEFALLVTLEQQEEPICDGLYSKKGKKERELPRDENGKLKLDVGSIIPTGS